MGITHKGSLLIVLLLFVTVKRLRKKTFHELSAMTFMLVCFNGHLTGGRKVGILSIELSLRLREAEILEKCMSRTHRHIQRSLTAIKMFTGLIEEKVRDLTEDQIRQIPIANVNIFEGGFLRIVNVRHRDGEAVLEDGFAEIPERPPESSSDEEE